MCTRFSLKVSVEKEQADAGRNGRTRLARPNSWARTGTGKYSFFPTVHLTPSRIGNLARFDASSALSDDHTAQVFIRGDTRRVQTVITVLKYEFTSTKAGRPGTSEVSM